jgi:2-polyprenyl-3-methyl-5-hydroxy-6-metoxy-1,4-benzoquinol methylase
MGGAWITIPRSAWQLRGIVEMLRNGLKRVAIAIVPSMMKRRDELKYWRLRYAAESGKLRNDHYEPLYTTVFDLTKDDFRGKRVLDIGCGPRGSLEWADVASQRVGLDVLADDYRRELGAAKHNMEYRACGAEKIPFTDAYFDIVTCLNALDHVDDIAASIREIKRVTGPGGLFLLSVETDHPPTPTEPVTVDDALLATLAPEFTKLSEFRVGTPDDHDLHGAVRRRSPVHVAGQPGIFVAKFVRN